MTNLLILSLQLFTTNTFSVGASDPYGSWAAWYCWNVEMDYVAPTQGVYVVEFSTGIDGAHTTNWVDPYGHEWTEWWGSSWIELNTDHPYLGRFTNSAPGTNHIRFPIIPEPVQYFRLKRVL